MICFILISNRVPADQPESAFEMINSFINGSWSQNQ